MTLTPVCVILPVAGNSSYNKAEHPLSPASFKRASVNIFRFQGTARGAAWFEIDSGCMQRPFFYARRCFTISDYFINEQIRDREVRVIDQDGEQLGIMSVREALEKAEEAGLDLVKIAPKAKPPVCKIVDYGKFRYEQTRREKEAKKKQKTVEIKEIRLSPNIGTNDLNTKASNARKFLSKGNRVKVTVRFRGREMAHTQNGRAILDTFAETLSDISQVEKEPKMEGRNMSMVLTEKR